MAYYFLGSLLSSIDIDETPEVSWREFKALLEENLSASDKEQMRSVLHTFDLENLMLYRQKRAVTSFGNWSHEEFEQLATGESELLNEAAPWLEKALGDKSGKVHNMQPVNQTNSQILSDTKVQAFKESLAIDASEAKRLFYASQLEQKGVASRVLAIIWKMAWISAHFRARLLGLSDALIQEPGSDHPMIESLLEELNQPHLQPYLVEEYKRFKSAFEANNQSLQSLAKSALQWQIDYLQTSVEDKPYSLERLLVHLVLLAWTERWQTRSAPLHWDPEASAIAAIK